MKQPIWLMLGLTVMGLGQLTRIQSAIAQDTGNPNNNSDITGVIVAPPIDPGNSVGRNIIGNFDPNSERLGLINASGGFGISPEIINSIPNVGGIGSSRRNTTGEDGGSASLGDSDNASETTSEITICSSDPCVPSNDTGKAITLNDLARLIEDDLNKSFNDLVAAEKLEQELVERPRRVIKRRSSNSCNCNTACVSPALEARREFEKKLQNSREFVKQIEILKPENSIW